MTGPGGEEQVVGAFADRAVFHQGEHAVGNRQFHMAASAHDQHLADVLLIAAWTGLRWSELREARVRDFVLVPMPPPAAGAGVGVDEPHVGQSRGRWVVLIDDGVHLGIAAAGVEKYRGIAEARLFPIIRDVQMKFA